MEHHKLKLTLPWEEIELSAQQQIIKVLSIPEVMQLAIMPDVHAGYDLCIGGVALIDKHISSSYVGMDIGCGMCFINTCKTENELNLNTKELKEVVFDRINRTIPTGIGSRYDCSQSIPVEFNTNLKNSKDKKISEYGKRLDDLVNTAAYKQLGTLGSGNHFIEIGINYKNQIGVTIHSGSRRCGFEIATCYNRLSKHYNNSFMPIDSELGMSYITDMKWAEEFALLNRKIMMRKLLSCLGFTEVEIIRFIKFIVNETHNHAIVNNDGTVLHRKGATPAEIDQIGVIPANQKDGVYITKGLGNTTFLSSASHGAGRMYSRTEAKTIGNVSDLIDTMGSIICHKNDHVLDEAPWAYKNINTVLQYQENILINTVDHFKPIIVIKGI